MSVVPTSPDRLAEVQQLVAQLADCNLDAQIMGRPVPVEQIAALSKAARLLQDHGVEWPPLLAQVLFEFAKPLEEIGAPLEPAHEGDDVATGLTRFFAAFRRENGLAPEA